MPGKFLFDLDSIDLNAVVFDQEGVRECNPQRGDMEQLNGIIWARTEGGRILGCKEVTKDACSVGGHIPGRPLLPGVLMIDTGAERASCYTRKYVAWRGFIGFG